MSQPPLTVFYSPTYVVEGRTETVTKSKLVAEMIEAGKDVTYYENIEGGHGGAANNAQAAHMSALAYSFLWEQLR